jgi:hypothetical protein
MLSMLCTYHMVCPMFLEFLVMFGKQDYAKGFYQSGFREEEHFNNSVNNILRLPELGRSGMDFQLSYNLRSVERVKYPEKWPWSTRQTVVHHSFDIENGRTFWLMVRGNKATRDRFQKVLNASRSSDLTGFNTILEAFSASLATHLMLCEWSRENWAAYISFIEEQLQKKSRSALSVPNVQQQHHFDPSEPPPPRAATAPAAPMANQGARRSNTSGTQHSIYRRLTSKLDVFRSAPAQTSPQDDALSTQSRIMLGKLSFSFEDLLSIQTIEEKANEALLVIASNITIMGEVRNYYSALLGNHLVPTPLKTDAKHVVDRFFGRVGRAISDLKLQQTRLETLSRMIADRKGMVNRFPTILDQAC